MLGTRKQKTLAEYPEIRPDRRALCPDGSQDITGIYGEHDKT